jgi:DNA modification methylase
MSGYKFIGIEMSEEYFEIACARVEAAQKERGLF